MHVTDARSVRGLWEQGFYGKGSLSRSEPSWMTREETRRGTKAKATSEEATAKRRLERQQVKWERARKEREAIDQKLSEEAEAYSTLGTEESLNRETTPTNVLETNSPALNTIKTDKLMNPETAKDSSVVLNGFVESPLARQTKYIKSPVGPLELLSLPNSSLDSGIDLEVGSLQEPRDSLGDAPHGHSAKKDSQSIWRAPVEPLSLLALPNSSSDVFSVSIKKEMLESNGYVGSSTRVSNHSDPNEEVKEIMKSDLHILSNGSALKNPLLDRVAGHEGSFGSNTDMGDKIVNGSAYPDKTSDTSRFLNGSATTNGHPMAPKVKRRKSVRFSPTVEKNTFIQTEPPSPDRNALATITTTSSEETLSIKNQEHTQLNLEEAFFLSYALGALAILDPSTKSPIPLQSLFHLFRRTSYFPPRVNPRLEPDDPFMVNYVVYHHFRSLGWVPRPGIKFSCDLLLYHRGPVFDHAEFGVIILPSYSDQYWNDDRERKEKEKRTWHWMNCINRVITQVKKTLILCYVDIPAPLSEREEDELGVHGVLGRYTVREVVMKRFSANRMRE